DHLVFDRIVISGACHVAMVIDAACRHFGVSGCELKDVVFTRVLVIPKDGEVRVQLVLDPQEGGRYTFRLISFDGARTDSWTGHAEGTLVIDPTADAAVVPLDEIGRRCEQVIPVEDFYALQERRSIHLGDSYQWLTGIRRGNSEALGKLDVPLMLREGWSGLLHPGIIDACFGLMLTCGDLEGDDTQVPFKVARICSRRMPSIRSFQAHARLDATSGHGVTGSMVLVDGEGAPLLEIEGLEARKIARSVLASAASAGIGNLLYDLAWQPAEGSASSEDRVAHGTWLVLGGEGAVSVELAELIRAQGERCYVVRPERRSDELGVDPLDPDGFTELLRSIEGPVVGVVHLWAAEPDAAPELQLDALRAAQQRGVGGLLHLVQALRKVGSLPRLWIVTQAAQAAQAATPGAIHAEQATLWGLGRALSIEQPDLPCVRVDLDPGEDEHAARLLHEIAHPGDESEIAWRAGRRYVHRLVRAGARAESEGIAIDPQATYLVTGGLGALGRRVAAWLCDKGARHLVLTSRHVPTSAIPELEQLGARGCDVKVVATDVAQQSQVSALFDRIRADMPPLKGVLHLAGTLDDGILTQQTWERFQRVMAPKVEGTFHLHQATLDTPLDFFVCFSSIAAILGSAGQGNYAAANAFEDALCHQRRLSGRPALSINWGPWAESGMAANVSARDRERIAAQGLLGIASDAALAALDALIDDSSAQRVVLSADWAAYQQSSPGGVLPSLTRLFAVRSIASAPKAWMREEIVSAPMAARPLMLQKLVRGEVAKVLGSVSPDEIGDRRGLTDLGLDSLQAIDLKNRFSSGLGTALPFTLAFDNPTIQHMIDFLMSKLSDLFKQPAPLPSSPPPEEAEPAEDLGDLSSDELLGLLMAELE
ncbi:MAG TPA: type I polyketide synthase, partial [Candidatus Nanopelagicales bacterium]|nr:type I polyketide synthase [Candidatus Nanopelagicales bacterium]